MCREQKEPGTGNICDERTDKKRGSADEKRMGTKIANADEKRMDTKIEKISWEREVKEKDMMLREISDEKNHAYVSFDARSVNESFARMVVMAFMTDMNPTLDELEDVKTAVSEAVTNAIIHGYGEYESEARHLTGMEGADEFSELHNNENIKNIALQSKNKDKQVELSCVRMGQTLWVSVVDHGVGIRDIDEAKQPFFSTKPDQERSGMGFTFMETFMDDLEVYSKVGEGTRVTMRKTIGKCETEDNLDNSKEQKNDAVSDTIKMLLSEECEK